MPASWALLGFVLLQSQQLGGTSRRLRGHLGGDAVERVVEAVGFRVHSVELHSDIARQH
jgi:hypothetical protein